MDMQEIVTRVAFCKKCFKNGSPKKGQKIMVHGSSSNLFKMIEASDYGYPGFTPHTFEIVKYLRDEKLLVSSICGIEGCGSYFVYEVINHRQRHSFLKFIEENLEFETFTSERWSALMYLSEHDFAEIYKV